VKIETQMTDEQTPLVASFCMTCLGDEDISRIRVHSPNGSLTSRSVGAVNSTKSSHQSPTSFEDPPRLRVKGSSTTENAKVAITKPARTPVDVDFSSSSGSDVASFGRRMSVGSSTGISLYSNEHTSEERWFPFFGGLEKTQTGSDSDDQSAISSRHSFETDGSSYFSHSTKDTSQTEY
jgi:hypothetical protein